MTLDEEAKRLQFQLSGAHYGQRLIGIDFSGAALASVATPRLLWLDRCLFVATDLRQATLDGCHFKLCDFTGANLQGASLRGASFAGCDLTGADLRGADLFDAKFQAVGVSRGARPTRLTGSLFDDGAREVALIDGAVE